jgi:hypothetical protein
MVGCIAGMVWPAGMVTLAADMLTRVGSLLASAIVTGPEAAADREMGKATVCPRLMEPPGGRLIVPGLWTVTEAVASAIPGAAAVAVIVVAPAASAVTGTFTVVAPEAKLTLGGTVATAVLLELKFTVRPAVGAAEARFSAMFCVMKPFTVTAGDANVIVVVTCTALDAVV